MGKKSGARAKASAIDLAKHNEDWNDNMSTTSSCTTFTTCAENFCETDKIDLFSSALDELFEKRGATREKALQALVGFLREDIREEECVKNETTMVSRCLNGVRKGSNTEAVLSAQLLALHMITLPEPSERLFRELQGDLQRAAASGKPWEVRCAAIECLAMCCFVAAEDDSCTLEVMERCRALWKTGEAKVRACSVRAWSFLATSLNTLLSAPTVESVMCDVATLLHDADVDVRNAAGELAALLCDVCGVGALLADAEARSEGASEEGLSEDGGEEGEEAAGGDSAASKGLGGLEGVVGRMRDLATGHKADRLRRNKREKAALRSTFRSVLAVVEDGCAAVTKVKLQHGDVLVVDTVRGGVMLGAFRRALGGGFQLHLQHNGLLHDVFEFTPSSTRPERLTALEKRAFKSPNSAASRAKTHERKGDRAAKANRHAMHAHGDHHDHW
mmetsp:Transcript_33375/g.84567  ORF Transcript_33375/g.84567 Transcript_33375/m.84567 type:complete len:447 (-) Transcript_33375:563-1903(-)